jgi:hypothetical protein
MPQKTISTTETHKHVSILCRRFTEQLEEQGVTLEIDKSKFRKRIRYYSNHVKGWWVFEGTERESGRTLLVTVHDTTAENRQIEVISSNCNVLVLFITFCDFQCLNSLFSSNPNIMMG